MARPPKSMPANAPRPAATPLSFRRGLACFAVATLVPLAAFLFTLHPGLPGGDSGELITAAWTGGIAHPPGYPLYVMLAGAWAHLLAFGEVAVRFNAFSSVCMALACGVLALAVRRIARDELPGVFAAWTFAFAAAVWKYAIVAEVFALNALLASCVLCFAAGLDEPVSRRAHRELLLLCALTVLSFSHHHTLLLLAIPAAVLAFGAHWQARAGSRVALVRDVGLAKWVALLPLLWLTFATAHRGAQVWGEADSWRGFFELLLRADYGTFQLAPVDAHMKSDQSHLLLFAKALPRNFGVVPLLLAAFGAAALGRTRRRFALALLGFGALQALFFTRVGFPSNAPWLRGVVERFYILPMLVLAALAGLGVAFVLAKLGREKVLQRLAGTALLALTIGADLTTHAKLVDQRGNHLVDALGAGVLASAPPHAVLCVQGDLLHNACVYRLRVRHERPDVTLLDQELMTYAWYVRRVRAEQPELLPPLGLAQRIVLHDGRVLEGFSLARADSLDVLTETSQMTLPQSAVERVVPAPAESLFTTSRADFRTGWPLERSEDRYSGLPGTRVLLWLDHWQGARPAVFVGLKDPSWALRYTMVPAGFALRAVPRATAARDFTVEAQADEALTLLEQVSFEPYFRPLEITSFEGTEAWRFPAAIARAALVVCQPEARAAVARHPRGHAALLAFAKRFESLDAATDPACMRAIGFLRLLDPEFRDEAMAFRDLQAYVASGAPGADHDTEVQQVLATLRGASTP